MRILAVHVRNLASLVGEQPALRLGPGGLESGLVAITGPTGAGKSTVLDAICLALFGDTPRLGGGGEDVKSGNILSRGTYDGFAEVEFEDHRGRRLVARWEVRRSKNEILQAPKMSLRDAETGAELATKRGEVVPAVQEAIGLTRDQFVGVVLLAQGSFSTFLTGKEDERGTLLERLTGAEVYTRLGKAAFAWRRRCEQDFARIETRMQEHRVLADDERATYQQELALLVQELEGARQAKDAAVAHVQRLERLRDTNAALAAAAATHARADAAWRAAEPERRRLADAERLEPLRTRLTELDLARRGAEQAARATEGAAEEFAQAQQLVRAADERERAALARALSALEALRTQQRELERFTVATPERTQELLGRLNDAQRRAAGLAHADRELDALRVERDRLERAEQEARAARDRLEAPLQSAQQELAALDEERTHEEAERGGLIARHERKQAWEDALEHWDAMQRLRAQRRELAPRLEAATRALREVEAARDAANGARATWQTRRREAEARWRDAQRRADVAEFRRELREGEPCPLCEQTVHQVPAAIAGERLRLAEEERERATAGLEAAEKEWQDTSRGVQDASTQLDRLRDEERRRAEQQAEHEARYAAVRARLPDTAAWPAPFANDGRLQLEQELERARSERESLDALQQRITACRARLQQAQSDASQQRSAAAEAERKLWTHVAALRARETQRRETGEEHARLAHALENGLAALASELGEDPPAAADAASWLERCRAARQRRTELRELLLELGPPLERQIEAWSRRAPSGAVLAPDESEGPAAGVDPSVARARIRDAAAEHGEAEALAQRQRNAEFALEAAQQQKARCDGELQEVTARFRAALAQHEVADEASLRASLLRPDELRELRAQVRDLERARVGASQQRALREQDRQQAEAAFVAGTVPSAENLPEMLRAARLDQSTCEQRSIELQQRRAARVAQLQQDDEARARLARLGDELDAARRERDRIAALAELIGDANGKRFRVLAQELTLEALVHHANRRLAQFAPRYALCRSKGLDLDVVDRDLADEQRPVTTLSGGESFLVSLALSIALSDLKRGRTEIRSVFIDEGFGSLDQQSLELALAALEHVQSQLGAQLVVISHVGDLQSRWDDVVEVRRVARGRSWLRVPGGPLHPPRDATGLERKEPMFDLDAAERILSEAPHGLTRGKLAEALGCANSPALGQALVADTRFELVGRRYRCVAAAGSGEEAESSAAG